MTLVGEGTTLFLPVMDMFFLRRINQAELPTDVFLIAAATPPGRPIF